MKNRWFNKHTGIVALRPAQGRPEKPKHNVEAKNKKKRVCLNCTKEKCTGNCANVNGETRKMT